MHKTLVSSVTTSFRVYAKRVLNNGLPQMCSAIFCWTERNSAGHFLHSAVTWCELWSPKSPILFEVSGQWVFIIIIRMSALGRFCVTAVMICIVFCRAFSHPAKFMSYIGLDQKPVQPSSADTCGINRSHVSTPQDVDPTLPPATTGLNSLASLSLGSIMAWPVSAPILSCMDCKRTDVCLSVFTAVIIIIDRFFIAVIHSWALTVLHMFLVYVGLF